MVTSWPSANKRRGRSPGNHCRERHASPCRRSRSTMTRENSIFISSTTVGLALSLGLFSTGCGGSDPATGPNGSDGAGGSSAAGANGGSAPGGSNAAATNGNSGALVRPAAASKAAVPTPARACPGAASTNRSEILRPIWSVPNAAPATPALVAPTATSASRVRTDLRTRNRR